ncbi:MAG: hypothetical protein ACI8P3_003523, partial [Saprospiraceae bacterium]
ATQGVRLIRLDEGDSIADVAVVARDDDDDQSKEEEGLISEGDIIEDSTDTTIGLDNDSEEE